MNASPLSPPVLSEGDNSGSDSDTNHDTEPEYYQPISAVDDDEHDAGFDLSNSDDEHQSSVPASSFHGLDNGYCTHGAGNGISSLRLNDDLESESSEEEEEETMGEASDTAVTRAFREDEMRRNAPLPAENARRVMEAMRRISFSGLAPNWVGQVPEEEWVDRLRRIRQSSSPPHPSRAVQN